MHEETVKFYSFAELKKEVQDKIIKDCQDGGVYVPNDWYESCIDMFKETMSEIGFIVNDVRFTGFNCQGDGASFTGEFADIPKALNMLLKDKQKVEKIKDYVACVCISRDSDRYSHKNTVSADVNWLYEYGMSDEEANYIGEVTEEVTKALNKLKDAMCETLYHELESWYNGYNNKEYIRSCLMDEDDEDYLADGTYMA